jgi:16S rRNA (uracil1498-N3)-methyltransferase
VDQSLGRSGAAVRAAAAAQIFVDDLDAPVPDAGAGHHLARVLRLRAGERVVAADGRGRWRLCEYRPPTRGRAEPVVGVLSIAGPVACEPAPSDPLTVAFAPPKGDRTEWVVQKLTELGIDRIVLLATERSVVVWDEAGRLGRVLERLGRVAREAAAQCRRVWLPEVSGVVGLEEFVDGHPDACLAQMGGPAPDSGVRTVAIGPEGGWSEAELARRVPTIGLGAHVLRAETAAMAAGAALGLFRAATVLDEAPRRPTGALEATKDR